MFTQSPPYIERCWRRHKHRIDFEVLMRGRNLSLAALRKYVHITEARMEDYTIALRLREARAAISRTIRGNHGLSQIKEALQKKVLGVHQKILKSVRPKTF